MSEDEKGEAFIGRWSRLKQQKSKEEALPGPPAEARQAPVPAAPLPRIEDLKPDSDFKPFMDPRVDLSTRRSALKMLFTDAHFSAIDPFEPYSIDLTGEDPISPEMLKTLEHAKHALFEEKPKAVDVEAPEEAQASPQPQAQTTEAENVAGKQDT